MTCDEEALSEYLDGELDPERRKAVEAHLGSCAPCAKTLERLKAASKAFKTHGAVPLPAGLGHEARGREASRVLVAAIIGVIVVLSVGQMFKPQVASIFNQVMGMISGAASTVGSGN